MRCRRGLAGAAPRLLVTAGSNGALVFNETMPKIVAELLDAVPGLTIVHQAGARQLEATRAAYAASGADRGALAVEAFLTDMPAQYAAADLVLARAGSTVAELCAAGKPSLLVPFPAAADDHQRKNAEVLVEAGAAVMLLQKDVTPARCWRRWSALLKDRRGGRRWRRGRGLAKPGALEKIAAMVVARLAAVQIGAQCEERRAEELSSALVLFLFGSELPMPRRHRGRHHRRRRGSYRRHRRSAEAAAGAHAAAIASTAIAAVAWCRRG